MQLYNWYYHNERSLCACIRLKVSCNYCSTLPIRLCRQWTSFKWWWRWWLCSVHGLMLDSHTYDSSKESHFPDIVRKNNTIEQDTQPNLSFIATKIAWEKNYLQHKHLSSMFAWTVDTKSSSTLRIRWTTVRFRPSHLHRIGTEGDITWAMPFSWHIEIFYDKFAIENNRDNR